MAAIFTFCLRSGPTYSDGLTGDLLLHCVAVKKIVGCFVCMFRLTVLLPCYKIGGLCIKKGYKSFTVITKWM